MKKSLFILLLSITVILTSGTVSYSDYDENRYIDNQDGTIKDTAIGLMWQNGAGPRRNWSGAVSYCEDSELGGYSDWGLPTLTEMQTLVDAVSDQLRAHN